jgi:hypothetical protein
LNTKINIAALASYRIYPAISGGQKGIALFYKYLSQLLPVTVISVKGNTAPDGENIQLAPLLSSSKLRYINPFLFFRLKRFIKKNNITHLVLEHPYYGWLGRMLKMACNIKLAVHSHNIEGLRFKSTGSWWWRILWQYEKWTHRDADINFFITQNDLDYAKKHFGLNENKCHLITYGTETDHIPSEAEKAVARKIITSAQYISAEETLVLFNGFFDYAPNLAAVDVILDKINPVLSGLKDFKYKLIICGKNLPARYNNLRDYADKNIIYPGFVPDIKPYFTGSDIFINPITDGGGIKTKLVEALSYNLSAVSTKSGATGIPASVTAGKMIIAEDGDIVAFCDAVVSINKEVRTDQSFFNHFYWGNIAAKAAGILTGDTAKTK